MKIMRLGSDRTHRERRDTFSLEMHDSILVVGSSRIIDRGLQQAAYSFANALEQLRALEVVVLLLRLGVDPNIQGRGDHNRRRRFLITLL
jgi:hypothetical protein